MADKHLEELVKLSKTKQNVQRQKNDAAQEAALQKGRAAARTDYQIWKKAIANSIESSPSTNWLSATHHYTGTKILGSRNSIFGNYKVEWYKLPELHHVYRIESESRDAGIRGYVSELQERLGSTFKVSGGTGGYGYYCENTGHIDHEDGSVSQVYSAEELYERDAEVTVRW